MDKNEKDNPFPINLFCSLMLLTFVPFIYRESFPVKKATESRTDKRFDETGKIRDDEGYRLELYIEHQII